MYLFSVSLFIFYFFASDNDCMNKQKKSQSSLSPKYYFPYFF
nr:MAG TPA: Photosystem II protein D1 [Caudoviricetes sp.]